MTRLEYWELIKTKKETRRALWDSYLANHPNRVELVEFSGTLTLTIDGRDFTGAGLVATKYEWDLDFSLLPDFTRKFIQGYPWSSVFDPPVAGEFGLAHSRVAPWNMTTILNTIPAAVTIGTRVATTYTRPTTGDPWTAGSPVTIDIDATHQISFTLGGDPDSGGFTASTLGVINYLVNFDPATFFANLEIEILRDVNDDTWDAETTAFSDALTDFIDNGNTVNGGGYSGTTDLTMTFS